jgi:hypothetical protein
MIQEIHTRYIHDTHTIHIRYIYTAGVGKSKVLFHHACFEKYYAQIKKKELADDEECNKCPECKTPVFKRKTRN